MKIIRRSSCPGAGKVGSGNMGGERGATTGTSVSSAPETVLLLSEEWEGNDSCEELLLFSWRLPRLPKINGDAVNLATNSASFVGFLSSGVLLEALDKLDSESAEDSFVLCLLRTSERNAESFDNFEEGWSL